MTNALNESEIQDRHRRAVTVHSAMGGLLGRIYDETEASLFVYPAQSCIHHTGERFLTDDELNRVSLQLEMFEDRPIDIRGNVREQVARQLREWAKQLDEYADTVEDGPPEPFHMQPQLYVAREIETKKVICESWMYGVAALARNEHFRVYRKAVEIIQHRLDEFPEAYAQFEQACQDVPSIQAPP